MVGIDGSEEAEDALRWAFDEAGMRQASLEVVHAWSFPAVAITHYGGAALPVIAPEDVGRAAAETAQETVAKVIGNAPAVPVTTTVERGHPAEVLVAAAKGADLLVVGSRGRGGFAGMLLGSVSTHVLHHAPCPVVLVRPPVDR